MTTIKAGKLLVLADVHINDYAKYRLDGRYYRLNQFIKLARQIDEFCKSGDYVIVLAGDTLDMAVDTPLVVHTLKSFLQIISNNGTRPVFHILGQHDMNCKEHRADLSASNMNLFPEYTTYVGNGSVVQVGNYSVAFRDWVPGDTADTSFITNPVDLFIGHVTNVPVFGQEIDRSKFKVALVGDIHKESTYGNVINIGTPFFHRHPDENAHGRFAVVDLEGNAPIDSCIQFVQIDPNNTEYLSINYVDNPDLVGFDKTTNTYNEYVPVLTVTDESSEQSDVPELDIQLTNDSIKTLIESTVMDNDLTDVHQRVIAESKPDSEPFDLNFELVRLTIENYRSIDKLDYEFNSGLTAIIGHIGSGKSSFINAMKLALMCGKIPESDVSVWATYAEINLVIRYHGVEYTLCSSTNPFAFKIGNDWCTASARDRVALAKQMLPFLNYPDVFVFTTEDANLLSAVNDQRKSEIISKFYNIDILDEYNSIAAGLVDEQKTKIKCIAQSKSSLETTIDAHYSNIVNKNMSESALHEHKLEQQQLIESLTAIVTSINERERLLSKIEQYESLRRSKSDALTQAKSILNAITASIQNQDPEELSIMESLMAELTALIPALDNYKLLVKQFRETFNRSEGAKQLHEAGLKKIIEDTSYTRCEYCGAELDAESAERVKQQKIIQHNLEYEKLNASYRESLTTLQTTLMESWTTITNRFAGLIIQYVALETCLDFDFNKVRDDLMMKIKSIKSINNEYQSKLSEIKIIETDLENCLQILEQTKSELANSEASDMKLDDVMTKLKSAQTLCLTYGNDLNLMSDINKLRDQLQEETNKLDHANDELAKLNRYCDLTTNTSTLYRSILQLIAKEFSNEQYKLVVDTYVYRGKLKLAITMKYLNGGYYFDYVNCSTAQKCFCDTYFLSKLLRNAGVLLMDEYFKSVPTEAMLDIIKILGSMNVNHTIFSSHHDSLTFNGTTLTFALDGNKSLIK